MSSRTRRLQREGYELLEVFLPHFSEESENEMKNAIEKYRLSCDGDDFISEDGKYLMFIESSGHERDSSADTCFLFKKL